KDELTAATSKAVSDVYDLLSSSGADYALKIHYHDAGDIQTGILDIARGGTGRDFFSDGFVKSIFGVLDSVEFLQIDDILGIRDAFSPMEHKHLWTDILDPPIASDVEPGIVKISSSSSIEDTRNTATSIDLFQYLEDKVLGLESADTIDAYTKVESDAKFIGYRRNLVGEYLDYVSQTGLYSSSLDNVNVGEPCIGPYLLEVSNFEGVITQTISGGSGVFIRMSQDEIWSEWAQQWDSNTVKGEATKSDFGFVKKTDLVDLDSPDSVPTNEAIRIYVGEVTGDSFEPAFQVLQVEKGGTGTSIFEHENGFIRISESEMYTVEGIEWDDILNVPYSSSDVAGIMKISDTVDHSDDPSTVAASLTLIKEIKEDIMGEVGVQAYTKEESDEKFLGKQEDLSIVDFDEVILAGIYPNNTNMLEQTNKPTLEHGILTVLASATTITQMYNDTLNNIYMRTFELGTLNTLWAKIASGSDIEIATEEKAGIFKVTDRVIDDNETTVPTTRLVHDAIKDLGSSTGENFVKKSGDVMTGPLDTTTLLLSGRASLAFNENDNSIDFSFIEKEPPVIPPEIVREAKQVEIIEPIRMTTLQSPPVSTSGKVRKNNVWGQFPNRKNNSESNKVLVSIIKEEVILTNNK
ncbi:MAG: pyocin knob domain-containing protein, partial [Fusobacteriaceae bacterium]